MPLQKSSSLETTNPVTATVALSVAPAAAGAGVGLLLAESLDRDARRAGGVVLLGVATLAALPWLASVIGKKVAGPATRRGRARTLSGIRHAGVGDYHYDDTEFDDFEDEEADQPVGG